MASAFSSASKGVKPAPERGAEGYKRGGKTDGSKWIQKAVPESHKGLLHKQLGIPEDKKIPAKTLAKAAHSDNPKLAARARFARNVKKLG